MNDINECRFSGTVSRCQIIENPLGTPMIRFSLLCGDDKISVVFRTRNRAFAQRLSKCSRLWASGRIRSDTWDGSDGIRRYGWKVVAAEVKPLDEEPGETA
jgi:hypothetical protein